ncbi:MAG TPA: hypothetical protein VGL53_00145 [Bryobacteraceae bacterium]|jgi:hypothetical protein
MTPLSPAVEERVALVFAPDEREKVRQILIEQCGENVPRWHMAGMDRMRFAVLKLSEGKVEKLERAISLAKADVRNVLVWSGLG